MRKDRFVLSGMTCRTKSILLILGLFFALYAGCVWYLDAYEPLYASVTEDPCYQDGVFQIWDPGDYVRFAGYLNRARKEEPDEEQATAIDGVLMADLDLNNPLLGPIKNAPFFQGDVIRYRLRGHPYIRQSILNYNGTFDGNGHTITWKKGGGNGMFVCIDRDGIVKDLTFCGGDLCWDMDEYGVGLICMVNYGTIQNCQTEGRIEGTECYTGGIAGINRGLIKDCINRAEVVLTGVGEYGAGGIAGLNKCEVLEGESEENPIVPEIRDCVNYGRVEGPWEAGGICAKNDCANLYACGNEGAVQVRYQRGYIYPDHPDWYDSALAAGICGDMGWNSIENCYNTGDISILEEGAEATYGIAGNTLSWINEVTGCVSLEGAAKGRMRHESVMELDEEELKKWKENPDSILYMADNWQFDLEEAKEKLPLVPLDLTEAVFMEEGYRCREFFLRPPKGYEVKEISPYALCVESENGDQAEQMWILRLPKETLAEKEVTKDTTHDLWTSISGIHWLHPSYSYKDDCHVRTLVSGGGRQTQTWILHYRDDILAHMAVGTEQGMVDNVTALPLRREDNGWQACWLMVFTNQGNNYRPSLFEVEEFLKGFTWLPCQAEVEKGDCLYGIARMYCGDGNRYPELAAYNEIDEMDPLLPGQILQIPQEWVMEMGAWE